MDLPWQPAGLPPVEVERRPIRDEYKHAPILNLIAVAETLMRAAITSNSVFGSQARDCLLEQSIAEQDQKPNFPPEYNPESDWILQRNG
jgi:hypothetical protein